MSTRILILKDGVITPSRNTNDITAIKNGLGVVDLTSSQTISGNKTFSSGISLPSSAGTSIGSIWRNVDNLEYKDSLNVTKILLNSAGNLSNLSNKQTALNNLVENQTANRVLRSNGVNVLLAQVGLTTDVIGVLPIANGGTGSSTQNWVDLTTNQSIAGIKTFSNTTATTSTTTGALIVSGGVGIAGNIRVKNAWLLEPRSGGATIIDANNIVNIQFASTQWIDGAQTNLNVPINAGMISQFDSLWDTASISKYRVQEYLAVGGGVNARFWKRTENNGNWGSWLEIAFLEKANTWTGIQNFTTQLNISTTKVLGIRDVGWTAPSGTANKGTFASDTATLLEVARRLFSLETALRTHGLIGT